MDPRDKIARAMYSAGKQELGSSPMQRQEFARKADKMANQAYEKGIQRSLEKTQREKHVNLRPYLK